MGTAYITDRTTTFYKNAAGSSRHGYLIFGDEVETTGNTTNNRRPIRFRSYDGFVASSDIGHEAPLEFYSVDVGQGDATFIVTPGRKKILIDGGLNHRALGFLVWRYRLDQPANSVDIDLMVLTHADGDHLKGLIPILEHPRIHVARIVHNGIALFDGGRDTPLGDLDPSEEFLTTRHSSLAELSALNQLTTDMTNWRDAVAQEGALYEAVDTATAALDVGDPAIAIDVLGPHRETDGTYKWLGNLSKHSHTINGHSVVLRLTHDNFSILLSGDLNPEGSEHLLAVPDLVAKMDAHVFKTPHHGSHFFDLDLLEAIRPQVSTISSGDVPDYGHPRAVFLGALGLASRSTAPLIFSTEVAATFVGDGETADPDDGTEIDGLDFTTIVGNKTARKRFKLMLPGIINIRTDGEDLYAHRRVNASYQWESYGPVAPAPRPTVFGP